MNLYNCHTVFVKPKNWNSQFTLTNSALEQLPACGGRRGKVGVGKTAEQVTNGLAKTLAIASDGLECKRFLRTTGEKRDKKSIYAIMV